VLSRKKIQLYFASTLHDHKISLIIKSSGGGGGIEYLNDLDSYADWSFIPLIGPPKSDRLKDRGQTK